MAQPDFAQGIDLPGCLEGFSLKETVSYPNGGVSYFLIKLDDDLQDDDNDSAFSTAVIIDKGICDAQKGEKAFSYSSITSKQNDYVSRFDRVFRFIDGDIDAMAACLRADENALTDDSGSPKQSSARYDRADLADASPLERAFEENFAAVYGPDSVKCLWREYGITDLEGGTRYLDYVVELPECRVAVEENGVSFHHPQLIGSDRYRTQLMKQNSCAAQGIKLYRFSTEDCQFADRVQDDIRSYFGSDAGAFRENGLVVDRPFRLYEHQENVLSAMAAERARGCKSFLAVLPTASGKSKIAEEDMAAFARERGRLEALVLVPNNAVRADWEVRVANMPAELRDHVLISSYQRMELHYAEYSADAFDCIVVDEAHHAVAPGLKRVIQYFQPEYLLGLTATDERPDRKRLESVFGAYRVSLSLPEAMERGVVARANVFRVETNIDLSRIRINGKDYINADLEKSIRVTSRNELIAQVIEKYFCQGEVAHRQGVVFCVNTAHCAEMERVLKSYGISACAYSSKTKDPERVMSDFRAHRIRFLCACQMISEGWDYPELGILVMARPTLSKVLYLQQLGRGLRKTGTKSNVFVVDMVDDYGVAAVPCSMHTVFRNAKYVPFGDILRKDYVPGEMIVVDGLVEQVERITEVDVFSFADKYGDYLSVEQLAREFFVSTDTIRSWVRGGRIAPTASFAFGSRKVDMFSPEAVQAIRERLGIPIHNDETILDDFFAFLEERDYSLSYKMPFLLSFLDLMDATGDAAIADVLDRYINFYQNRLDRGLPVDRSTCPYTAETFVDKKYMQQSMLRNPFEKFERKRFMYHSKKLGILSMNHALHARLTPEHLARIRQQMQDDLANYYADLGGV